MQDWKVTETIRKRVAAQPMVKYHHTLYRRGLCSEVGGPDPAPSLLLFLNTVELKTPLSQKDRLPSEKQTSYCQHTRLKDSLSLFAFFSFLFSPLSFCQDTIVLMSIAFWLCISKCIMSSVYTT